MKTWIAGPPPTEFTIQWGGGGRICVVNKLQGDADALGQGITLGEPLVKCLRIWAQLRWTQANTGIPHGAKGSTNSNLVIFF